MKKNERKQTITINPGDKADNDEGNTNKLK